MAGQAVEGRPSAVEFSECGRAVFGKGRHWKELSRDAGKIGLSGVAPADRGGEEIDPGRRAGGAVDHRKRKAKHGEGGRQFKFKFKFK